MAPSHLASLHRVGRALITPTLSDEPVFAGSNLVFKGNDGIAKYSGATNAERLIAAAGEDDLYEVGDTPYMMPSPGHADIEPDEPTDPEKSAIETEGGRVYLRCRWPTAPDQNEPAPKIYLYHNTPVPVHLTHYLRFKGRLGTDGVLTDYVSLKFLKFINDNDANGHTVMPQWSMRFPEVGGLPGNPTQCWEYWDGYEPEGGEDDGNQGCQPFGPYPTFDSVYRRYTAAYRPHTSPAVRDGFARMWVDGIKIIDVSLASAGITPAGGGKPWCTVGQVNGMLTMDDFPATGGDFSWWWGGTQPSINNPNVWLDVKVGNNSENHPDTTIYWTSAS